MSSEKTYEDKEDEYPSYTTTLKTVWEDEEHTKKHITGWK